MIFKIEVLYPRGYINGMAGSQIVKPCSALKMLDSLI